MQVWLEMAVVVLVQCFKLTLTLLKAILSQDSPNGQLETPGNMMKTSLLTEGYKTCVTGCQWSASPILHVGATIHKAD